MGKLFYIFTLFFATLFYNLRRKSLKRGKYPDHHIDENKSSKKSEEIEANKKCELY